MSSEKPVAPNGVLGSEGRGWGSEGRKNTPQQQNLYDLLMFVLNLYQLDSVCAHFQVWDNLHAESHFSALHWRFHICIKVLLLVLGLSLENSAGSFPAMGLSTLTKQAILCLRWYTIKSSDREVELWWLPASYQICETKLSLWGLLHLPGSLITISY